MRFKLRLLLPRSFQASLAVMLCTTGSVAQAVELDLTPWAGYRFGGQFAEPVGEDDVDVEESATFGVAFDVGYAPGQAIEVFYSRQSTDVEGAAPFDLEIEYFQVGGMATFESDTPFEPFAVGTVGAARLTPGPGGVEDETRFAATLGGGIRYPLGERLALRFEIRGYFTFFDSDAALFCVSDEEGATCRVRAKSSVVWQAEAQAGVSFRF